MRLIGHLENEAYARRFADYLCGRGVESHVEQDGGGRWDVWIVDDVDVDDARPLLARFSQHPEDPAFVQAAQAVAAARQREQTQQTTQRAHTVNARQIFYSPGVPVGALSILLIAISVVVAIATDLGRNDRLTQPMSITQHHNEHRPVTWRTCLPEVRQGQIWRLFTPIFLHFGVLHLLFNMLWLRDLGSIIEARKGIGPLLILVLVLAGTSDIAQYLHTGPAFGGMSGVVYGLLGYIWMQSTFNPASGLSIQPQTVTMMIVWFVVCLTGLVGPIANTAHAVGFVVGIAWGFLSAQLSPAMERRD